jgi:hypothetical protein
MSFSIDENNCLQIDDDFIIFYGFKQQKILDLLNEGKTVLLYKNLVEIKKDNEKEDDFVQKVNGLVFSTASGAFLWEEENKDAYQCFIIEHPLSYDISNEILVVCQTDGNLESALGIM